MSLSPRFARLRRMAPVLLAALAFLPASPAAADTWAKLGDRGLADLTPGGPTRTTATAVAHDGTSLYVSSHTATSTGAVQPSVFRHRAGRWTNITPAWGAAGKVTDMVVFRGTLLVATDAGIWAFKRETLREYWVRGVAVSGGIRAMAQIGGSICVVHGILSVSCSADPLVYAYRASVAHPRGTDATVQSARLADHRGHLYLGFGGGAAGSRRCEVWKLDASWTRWVAVDTGCFGRPMQTWVLSMRSFGGWLYIGTGGHDGARIFRYDEGSGYAATGDATPYALYSYADPFGAVPVRYQAMAATSTHLFVGTRTSSPPNGGDVVRRDAAGAWARANTPGFGESNDQVTALTAAGSTVFAATINGGGFQVWQRTG